MEPYKGLRPYEEQDQDNFFGREVEKRILTSNILTCKLTLLFAASGVGKSSLLQAAVLPHLKRPDGENLDVVYFKDWVDDPIKDLKKNIAGYLRQNDRLDDVDALYQSQDLKEFLQVSALFTSQPLVLILDQFEEFFNYQRYTQNFQPFIRELSAAILDNSTATAFVISMREDFALELNAFKPRLATVLFDNFYRLERLTQENAQKAIVTPVDGIGFQYESGLLDELLTDLSQREQIERLGLSAKNIMDLPSSVEPPHLQIVCTQLWEAERDNPDRRITKAMYERKGRSAGLLRNYFRNQVEQLSPLEKATASASFNYLVNKQGTKMAYPLKDLAELLRIEAWVLTKTLDKLEQARILRKQSRQGVMWYELYHDIFSKSIYDWNEAYKARQRAKKISLMTGAVLAGAALVFAGFDVYMNATHYHLRLSPKSGVSDVIELYQGEKDGFLDVARQREYLYETSHKRADIEPDKLFNARAVLEFEDVTAEIIERFPLAERLEAYWETGYLDKALNLASCSVSGDNIARSKKLINTLGKFRSVRSLEQLGTLLETEQNASLRSGIVTVLGASQASFQAIPLIPSFLKNESKELRSSAAEVLGQLGDTDAVSPLIELLKDRESSVRVNAVNALSRLGDADAVTPLIALLKDQNSSVRQSVVEALDRLGSAEAVKPLIELLKDKNEDIRNKVASALSGLGNAEAVKPLIELLKDQSSDVRSSAVMALGQLGNAEAVIPLAEAFKDQQSSVRNSAAEALSEIGRINAATPLLIRYLKDPDTGVVRNAVKVLGRFQSIEALKPLVSLMKKKNFDNLQEVAIALGMIMSTAESASIAETERLFVELLSDEDIIMRLFTLESMSYFATDKHITPLINLIKTSRFTVFHDRAINILSRLDTEQVVNTLTQLLKDKNPDIKIKATNTLASLGRTEAVKPLIKLLKDQDPNIRHNAVETLGQLDNAEAATPLVELLNDQNFAIRNSAAEILGRLGDTDAVTPLIALLKDQDWRVRNSAMEALGRLGSADAVTPLIALLKDQDWSIRNRAGEELGRLGDAGAVAPLIALLKDQDSDIRRHAAKVLGSLDDADAVAPLIALLKDQDSYVRRHAATALGSLGGANAVAPLIALLKDQDRNVRNSVAEALGRLGDPDAVTPLIALLKDQDGSTRNSVAKALGRLGYADAVMPLLALLKDRESDVLRSAIYALGKLGGADAITPLIALLKDQSSTVRNNAAEVLGRLGNADAIPPLTVLLKDRDPDIRSSATEALVRLDNAGAVRHLIPLLKDEYPYTRRSTAEALGRLGNAGAVRHLIPLLKDGYPYARGNAAKALGYLGNMGAARHLISLLKDRYPYVRGNAAEALGRLGNADAIRHLIPVLKDRDSDTRGSAVEALGRLGNADAAKHLIPLLKDQNSFVRNSAAKALAQLGSADSVKPLIKLLKDSGGDIRSGAAEALGQLGSVEAVRHLIALLKDQESSVRGSAAKALAQLGSVEAVGHLIALLKDQKPSVRSSAANALAQLSSIEAVVKPLLELLKERNSKVRFNAAFVLVDSGHSKSMETLLELLKNPTQPIEVEAIAKNSSGIQQPEPLQEKSTLWKPFIGLLKAETSEVKIRAIQLFKSLPDEQAFPALSQLSPLLEDTDLDVRFRTARALHKLLTSENLPPDARLPKETLREKFEAILLNKQEHIGTRFLALKSLKKMGAEKSVQSILALLEPPVLEKNPLFLESIRILGKISAADALPLFRELLDKLNKRKHQWRTLRDADTQEQDDNKSLACSRQDSGSDEKSRWPYEQWEIDLGYAMARIEPAGSGIDLLSHNLANVRKGAWLALGQMQDTALLAQLIKKREQSEQTMFRHAAYRAIDKILITIEVRGGTITHLQALQTFLPQIKDKQGAVHDRMNWTVKQLEYRFQTQRRKSQP
ncbi:MAG: hypothetical protein GY862_08510 [Gammaproteobacteria bacterium]|nr:hypothetical protein [Gammaproteobacteria bacterium]